MLLGEFAGCECIDTRISDGLFDLVKGEWNHRPVEDDLRSKLEVAIRELERFHEHMWEGWVHYGEAKEALAKIKS